ncbi:hypothetical protein [Planococcus halotolerans]|uniref:hypothetical protein n=1 Tax=Planococcus halotolerans TaxID=2233542 RepID=UPI001057B0B1|nr:hypothetical protein [Planococcus halotolerans]
MKNRKMKFLYDTIIFLYDNITHPYDTETRLYDTKVSLYVIEPSAKEQPSYWPKDGRGQSPAPAVRVADCDHSAFLLSEQ